LDLNACVARKLNGRKTKVVSPDWDADAGGKLLTSGVVSGYWRNAQTKAQEKEYALGFGFHWLSVTRYA
jgi:hypothetical protein